MWSLKQFGTVATTRVSPFAWAKPTVSLHAPRCSIVSVGCALFDILRGLEGYQNDEWLMKTNAPDRGRDLSFKQVNLDSSSTIRTERVKVQAKHYTYNSVGPSDTSHLSRDFLCGTSDNPITNYCNQQ